MCDILLTRIDSELVENHDLLKKITLLFLSENFTYPQNLSFRLEEIMENDSDSMYYLMHNEKMTDFYAIVNIFNIDVLSKRFSLSLISNDTAEKSVLSSGLKYLIELMRIHYGTTRVCSYLKDTDVKAGGIYAEIGFTREVIIPFYGWKLGGDFSLAIYSYNLTNRYEI
ncbi:hypothetical protein [Limnohabitans sp.]|uniref:hypothetical protein n=1 Tax=Limnohabitans sp. TaxID=1907725 RepID=UPI00286FA5BA|nr:hypothetical protein [Limnohabitans sp.]